jgi:CubicO group peptidase (beta-lactamase class C family)
MSAIRRLWMTGICAALLAARAFADPAPLPPQPADVPWPTQDWPTGAATAGADAAAIARAEDALFARVGRGGLADTRALLIVQGGRLVRERYADGFGPDSRFRSWSMAKSVLNALIGIRVRDGALALDAPAPVPAWQKAGDPRGALTLRHLLTMTSGLDNADGGADPDSYVARILFGDLSADTAGAADDVALVHAPGSFWAYSTGTSQILSGILARSVGGGRAGVRGFAERELAAPIGIRSLVLEFDAAGTPLGGAYVWASARDWARLGTLYLRDGAWDGRRILPEGWVDVARTPAPASNNGTYGAHFWVNGTAKEGQFQPLRTGLDAFEMSGNAGQYVVVVPDRDLVLVRLGETQRFDWVEIPELLSELVEAFPRVTR